MLPVSVLNMLYTAGATPSAGLVGESASQAACHPSSAVAMLLLQLANINSRQVLLHSNNASAQPGSAGSAHADLPFQLAADRSNRAPGRFMQVRLALNVNRVSYCAVDESWLDEVGGDGVQAGAQHKPQLAEQLPIEHSLHRCSVSGETPNDPCAKSSSCVQLCNACRCMPGGRPGKSH